LPGGGKSRFAILAAKVASKTYGFNPDEAVWYHSTTMDHWDTYSARVHRVVQIDDLGCINPDS